MVQHRTILAAFGLTLACAIAAPASAQTVTAIGAGHLTLITDINHEEGMTSLRHTNGATPINRRLDVAHVTLARHTRKLTLAVEFEHGSRMPGPARDALGISNYLGDARDHTSLDLDRQIYVGMSAKRDLPHGWQLLARLGAQSSDFADRAVAGNPWRNHLLETRIWRSEAGLGRQVGAALASLTWQHSAETPSAQGGDSLMPQAARPPVLNRFSLGLTASF
jgi:hypothetical protein